MQMHDCGNQGISRCKLEPRAKLFRVRLRNAINRESKMQTIQCNTAAARQQTAEAHWGHTGFGTVGSDDAAVSLSVL